MLETQAKFFIQKLILVGHVDLVWSYVLKYENSKNIYSQKKMSIAEWRKLSVEMINWTDSIERYAIEIEKTGIKPFDALHIACAITANCDYLITVDKRMLKYKTDKIAILNPLQFVNEYKEASGDD